MADPSKKECVQTLVQFIREENRVVSNSRTTSRMSVPYLVYQCPKGDLCRNESSEVSFQKNRGYTNPFDHLVSCYKSKNEIVTEVRRKLAMETESNGGPLSQDVLEETANTREKALFSYLEMVISCNAPLSIVENQVYRDFSKYQDFFSRRYLKEILYSLVELVEKKIRAEMSITKGSILHDVWTFSGCHYIGLFATYIRKSCNREEVCSPLLSMSPMAKICKCEEASSCKCTSEATEFDANTHADHIRKTFELYEVNFSSWAICQTADNCNLNRSVTSILGIPHIGCSSHKLNLEVEDMVRADIQLKMCIDSVHRTMSDCRTKLKNRAMLRNLTTLCPVIHNETRWSGKYLLLSRFGRIYDQLRAVAEDKRSTVAMNLTPQFKSDASNFTKMLCQINYVTKYLQTEHLTLSDSRLALDTISESVSTFKDNPQSDLHNCNLGIRCISKNSRLVTHKTFECGIIKIQRNLIRSMNASEKQSCRKLLVTPNTSIIDSDDSDYDYEKSILQVIAEKKRKFSVPTVKYMNANFVLGSVAIVERLWSLAKNVLQDHRKLSTPMLVEAILFLKVNRSYWDLGLVCEAISAHRSRGVADRMAQDEQWIEVGANLE